MTGFKTASKDERVKLLTIIGEKDVELRSNQAHMKAAFEALTEVAKILEELSILQENKHEWEHLQETFNIGLRRLKLG